MTSAVLRMEPRDDRHSFDPRRKDVASPEDACAFLRGLLTEDELLARPAAIEEPVPQHRQQQYWWQRD